MRTRRKKSELSGGELSLCLLTMLLFLLIACQLPRPTLQDPTIELAAEGKDVGPWKVIASSETKLLVTAPGASEVKVIYQPITTVHRYAELGVVTTAGPDGKFVLVWKPKADFTGNLWAEAKWGDGTKKKSNVLALASEEAISLGGDIPLDRIGNSAGTNESARSDKLTGSRIVKASLTPGDARIWITVDVPAFCLTLWQNSKEITTYNIGVGRLDYQLPVGERKATEIIWNPEWIPPNSKWVTIAEPGEKIGADDPRNPLGKIKIRLGNAILIHEAAKPTDIGRLTSHGCIRMLTEDLFDLTEKMVAACKLPVTKQQLQDAKINTDRLAVKLDPPVWVDVNYDTHVIEGGVLHLYPDVYKREKDDLTSLRQTLADNRVSSLDDNTLRQMLGRVRRNDAFLIRLSDLKAGYGLAAGKYVPLVEDVGHKPEA